MSRHPVLAAILATLIAVALAIAFSAVMAAPAAAQIVRAFTPRFSANDNGDITLIANTLMSCTGNGSGANSY